MPPGPASRSRHASNRRARARTRPASRTPTPSLRSGRESESPPAGPVGPRARRRRRVSRTARRRRMRSSREPSVQYTAMGTYNHTGQVVTDLERSKRFYQEVFGFKFWYEITPPDEATAKLSCLKPPLGMTASYLTLDGFVLELMHYSAEGATA